MTFVGMVLTAATRRKTVRTRMRRIAISKIAIGASQRLKVMRNTMIEDSPMYRVRQQRIQGRSGFFFVFARSLSAQKRETSVSELPTATRERKTGMYASGNSQIMILRKNNARLAS